MAIPADDSSPSQPPPPPPGAELVAAMRKHAAPPLPPVLEARGLGPYRGYAQMLEHVEALSRAGFRLRVIGKSTEGEPIVALHAGAEPAGTLVRTTVVLSGVHPMEWIGVESHLRLLDRLAAAPLEDRALVCIPVVNPDGIRRVEANLRSDRRRFVRHNARGVDLNRNFDHAWGKLSLLQRLLSGIFRPGAGPASEPETQAIAHHLARCRVDRALSLHSFGGAVLYPRASSLVPIHDLAEHRAWAARIAHAADPKPYVYASCARWAKGVTAGGLELDWFHDRHGALSLLVECSRGGRSLRPSKLLTPFAWFNPPDLARQTNAIAGALVPYVVGADP